MAKHVIKLDKEVKYLSEVMDDLPHDAFIDKGVTCCGGTTIVLTNNEYYIVAVHSIALLKNKCEQHPDVLGVYGDTNLEEINDYLEFGGKKIIVTYDSLPRLIKYIDPKQFRLLVDEVQILIRYAGAFKSKVCNDLINNSFDFKSVSYMTATPPPHKYLPKPMKELPYYQYKWSNITKPNINHKYVGNQVYTKTVSYILNKWENTSDDIFIFFNSRNGVINTIKKLIKAEPDIDIKNINIFFSNNDNNETYFKRNLGENFNISIPLSSNNKRINFVSSFGFEGVDFYNKRVSVLVVSDPRFKSMRYDISIDLPQIIGRFRSCRDSDIDFIWSTYTDQVTLSEEEFINKFKKDHDEVKRALSGENADNRQIMKAFHALAKSTNTPHCYIDRDDNDRPLVQLNKYAFESMMSSYHAMNSDYYVIKGDDKECKGLDRVHDIFNVNGTLNIPTLSLKYSSNLNRTINFKETAKRYVDLLEELESTEDIDLDKQIVIEQNICEIIENCEEIAKYHNILSVKDFKQCMFLKKRLKVRFDEITIMTKIKRKDFTLLVGKTYSSKYCKMEMQRIYNKYEIEQTPKASDIKNWFNVKSTSKYDESSNTPCSAYKILD